MKAERALWVRNGSGWHTKAVGAAVCAPCVQIPVLLPRGGSAPRCEGVGGLGPSVGSLLCDDDAIPFLELELGGTFSLVAERYFDHPAAPGHLSRIQTTRVLISFVFCSQFFY